MFSRKRINEKSSGILLDMRAEFSIKLDENVLNIYSLQEVKEENLS